MPLWPAGLHQQNGTQITRGQRSYAISRIPVEAYGRVVHGVPLGDGQGQATISAAGTASVVLGPQGIGTVWYPAAVAVTTTTGVLDTSACASYVGAGTSPIGANYQATIFPAGQGTLALAVPPVPVGSYVVAELTSGHSGDRFTVNVIGAKDAWAVA